MLSTTCKFVLLPGQMDRYGYAIARREDIDHTFQAVRRSCFQRVWATSARVRDCSIRMPCSESVHTSVAK